MNKPDLRQFARQLAAWTELVIEHGRTPFRKVTLYTPLQTEQGLLTPPLIFWINRPSMMAGGLVLLPEQDLAAELERGRCCAEALALRHFVTWETDRVRIWQLTKGQITEFREFKIGPTDQPDSFRLLLNELLEALKLLAVLGLVPPAELSAHYLHNLFLVTLERTYSPLRESCRRQRALEEDDPGGDADWRAREINRLTLLQLLALLWHRQLPSAILPEKLDRAIELSLPKLPLPLRQALARPGLADSSQLPHESAVCFHHLLLRLRQLDWRQPADRALASIRLLIDNWYPAEPSLPAAPGQFYPPSPLLSATVRLIGSDSATLLAAQALLEDLLQQPGRQLYFGNLFQFGAVPLPAGSIAVRLLEQRQPAREERTQYQALLRTSWPNRRFRIAADTPLWRWEVLHLLGLCGQQQELLLTLPAAALQIPATDPFWSLLQDNFRILELRQGNDNLHHWRLCRGGEPEQTIRIIAADGPRQLSPQPRIAALRAQLLLAVALPAPIFALIDREFLWPNGATAAGFSRAGLEYYAKSWLGQRTWQLLSDAPFPAPTAHFPESLAASGWPVPETELLVELEQQLKNSRNQPSQAQIDQRLAELLRCPEIEGGDLATLPLAAKTPGKGAGPATNLKKEIHSLLRDAGLPLFPEQYLYFLDHPETANYRLTPPLKIHTELLGQFELLDGGGETLRVYGEELATALLLCGELARRECDLPTDRAQLALILDYYRQDLRNLQQQLRRLCHSRLASSAAARKMANAIWRELQLPAEKWFAD